MLPITIASHAPRTARHAILTLPTQYNNVRHVIQGLYLIHKCKIANYNATQLLSSIGILVSALNVFQAHFSTNQFLPARNAILAVSLANSIQTQTHPNV